MIGLVYKDLMVMKKTLLIYGLITVVYGYLDIANEQTGMMFAVVLIISAMVPVSALAYDERSNWDKVVNTTPLSRKEVILAKYLLALQLTAVSALAVFVIYLFKPGMSLTTNIATAAVMALMAMVYQALLLPVMIKFGSEKGRLIMMAVMFAPVLLIGAIAKVADLSALADFMQANTRMLPFITVAVVTCIYIASVKLSVKIYENKDL